MKPLSPLHRRFGQRVRDLRKLKNLTQEDLAFDVGVDRSYLGFVERGEKNPTLEKIGKIAIVLKIELSELFDFKQ